MYLSRLSKIIEYTAPCSRNKKPGRAQLCCAARCVVTASPSKNALTSRVRPAPADCAWLQPPPAASRVRAHASSTAGHSRPEDQYQHGPLLGLFPKVQLFELFLIYLLFSLRTLLYSYNRPFDSVAPCFFCLETRL